MANPTTVTRGTFAREDELKGYLNTNGVDTTDWGSGKAKNVKHLFKEVENKVPPAAAPARLSSSSAGHLFFYRACSPPASAGERNPPLSITPTASAAPGAAAGDAAVPTVGAPAPAPPNLAQPA